MTYPNTFDEYQERTKDTAFGNAAPTPDDERPDEETILYLALALGGEVGEVQEKVKKYAREGDTAYLDDLLHELGDVLWYLARLSDEAVLDLDYVAMRNLKKLESRDERDALVGEGDSR